MTASCTSTTKAPKKPVSQEKGKTEILPEKASKRSLYIRRAIEDHFEDKRLKALSDDNWWEGA